MQNTNAKRLNITIAGDTWEKLKITIPRMKRSEFINGAVRRYLTEIKKKSLRQKLKEEALQNFDSDLKENNEWINLDDESWNSIK